MQYNKYILAFALLASSAFAAYKGPAEPKYDDLIKKITDAKTDYASKPGSDIDFTGLGLDGDFTPDQQTALKAIGENLSKANMEAALKGVYAKEKNEFEDKVKADAKAIFSNVSAGGKVSALADDKRKPLTDADIAKIKAFEDHVYGRPFTQEDIQNFLLEETIPTLPTPAAKILEIAKGGNISAQKVEDYKTLLTGDQYTAIEKYEGSLGHQKLTEALVTDYLKTDGKLPDLPNLKAVSEAIMAVAKTDRISAQGLDAYGTNLTQAHYDAIKDYEGKPGSAMLTAETIEKFLVKDGKLPDVPAVADVAKAILDIAKDGNVSAKPIAGYGVNLNAERFKAIEDFEKSAERPITKEELEAYLKDGTAPVVSELEAKVNQVHKLTDDKTLLTTLEKDEKLTKLVSAEQLAAIVKKEDGKAKITKADLKAILEKAESTGETKGKDGKDPKTKTEAELKKEEEEEKKKKAEAVKAATPLAEKVVAALKDVTDFNALSADQIKALGLNEKQIAALKKAAVKKDSTDIATILAENAEVASTGGQGTGNGQNNTTVDTQFYQQPLFIGLMVLLGISVIGGGIFMMTRKNEEETDL